MFFLNPEIKGLNSVRQLMEDGKMQKAFQIVLELEQGDDLSPKELLSCKLVKANLLRVIGNYPDAIEIAKEIFREFQKQGDLVSSLDALLIQAYTYMITVNLTQSEHLIPQIENLFKAIKEPLSIDLKERESFFLRIKAAIHSLKGEFQRSLELNKKAYDLAKETGNTVLIVASLNNTANDYFHMKEYDMAIMYGKQAIKNDSLNLAVAYATLIETYVSKGDIKEAIIYLDRLHEFSENYDSKWNRTLYSLNKALILKSSLRARDRIKAEDLFKKIALDSTVAGTMRIDAIIYLCDLYLTELRITHDPEIINEIHPYIQELLSIAKKQDSHLYLAETLLLQAKLSLLTLDIKEAKRFLTRGQKVAESHGIKQLAMRISNEHDYLLGQEKLWNNFKQSKVPFSERLELAGLNQQMDYMTKRQIFTIPQQPDEEPVLLLLLSEGGVPFFSHTFVEDRSFKSHLFGGFLTTIDYFIREMFSEGLDRAIFGDYTLVMKSLTPFFVSYIFKGNSYYALQKTDYFIECIKKDEHIWAKLLKYLQANQSIQLKDIPQLDSLIIEIFIPEKSV
ncbi:MAG: tetratricopeptide repeat protein [Candidatus Lokiarchaeota archaeon]|nr:tetratricopeptide repeat protein [Candidatus Lokiarchaeota archaeon]